MEGLSTNGDVDEVFRLEGSAVDTDDVAPGEFSEGMATTITFNAFSRDRDAGLRTRQDDIRASDIQEGPQKSEKEEGEAHGWLLLEDEVGRLLSDELAEILGRFGMVPTLMPADEFERTVRAANDRFGPELREAGLARKR